MIKDYIKDKLPTELTWHKMLKVYSARLGVLIDVALANIAFFVIAILLINLLQSTISVKIFSVILVFITFIVFKYFIKTITKIQNHCNSDKANNVFVLGKYVSPSVQKKLDTTISTLFSEPRKKILMLMIFGLSILNGYSTVIGYIKIFPLASGLLVGIGSQVILFMLLTNLVLINTPFRKWCIILILTTFSIYTSFFSYYEALDHNETFQQDYERASKSHFYIQSTFYTPLENALREAIHEKGMFENQYGTKYKAKEFAANLANAESKITKLRIVETIKPLFQYDIKGLRPEDFFIKDKRALESVPKNLWPKKYINTDISYLIKKENYFADTNTSKFIFPFQKLKEGGQLARISFFIAAIENVIMMLLSTSIEERKTRPFMAINRWFYRSRHLARMIVQDVKNVSAGISGQEVEYINISLKGKGTDFLEFFIESVNNETLIINVSGLRNHPNPTFRAGYETLISALCSEKRRWCTLKNGNYILTEKYISPFYMWINEELIAHTMREEKLSTQNRSDISIENFQIGLPHFL
jgi:hypothetical protein